MSYLIDDDASQIRGLKDKIDELQALILSNQSSVSLENVESGQSIFPGANPSARGGGSGFGVGGGMLPLGSIENEHLEWDNTAMTWNAVQSLTHGPTGPFADSGFNRFANDQIMLSTRNIGDDGNLELKVDSADFFDFTESFNGIVGIKLRAQHATNPDNTLTLTQFSGTTGQAELFSPNRFHFFGSGSVEAFNYDQNRVETLVNINPNADGTINLGNSVNLRYLAMHAASFKFDTDRRLDFNTGGGGITVDGVGDSFTITVDSILRQTMTSSLTTLSGNVDILGVAGLADKAEFAEITAPAGDPDANTGWVYGKVVGGTHTEPYWEDELGTVTNLLTGTGDDLGSHIATLDLDLTTNTVSVLGGGAGEGMSNIGQLTFVDNLATPVDAFAIYSDGVDLFANTGGKTVNLSNIGGTLIPDGSAARDHLEWNGSAWLAQQNISFDNNAQALQFRNAIDSAFITFQSTTGNNLRIERGDLGATGLELSSESLTTPKLFTMRQLNIGGFEMIYNTDGTEQIFQIAGTAELSLTATTIDVHDNGISQYVGWTAAAGQTSAVDTNGVTWTLPNADEYTFQIDGGDQLTVKEDTIDVHDNSFAQYIGWTAAIGQTETLDAGGVTWTLPTGDSYDWIINGIPIASLTSVGLAMSGTAGSGNISLGENYMTIDDISTPANPGTGARRLFVDTATGELSVRTAGGTTVSLESSVGGVTFPIEPVVTDNSDTWTGSQTLNLNTGDGHIYKWTLDQNLTFAATVSNVPTTGTQRTFELEFVHDGVGGTFTVTLPTSPAFVDEDGVSLASFDIASGRAILSCRVNEGSAGDIIVLQKNVAAVAAGGATELDDLTDVTIGTPSANTVLKWSGSMWVDGNVVNANVDAGAAIAISKLAITGTPDGTKFLRDDDTWVVPTAGSQTPWTSNIDADGFDLQDFGDISFTNGHTLTTTGSKMLIDLSASTDTFQFEFGDTTKITTFSDNHIDFFSDNTSWRLQSVYAPTTPANNDTFALYDHNFKNSIGTLETWASLELIAEDVTDGTEDTSLELKMMQSGTLTTIVTWNSINTNWTFGGNTDIDMSGGDVDNIGNFSIDGGAPSVTGATVEAALTSLLSELSALGLITDNTTY